MIVKGIDVSRWQGVIDFSRVKADGYKFVIISAGYGKFISQKDPYFERNYKNAKAAGLDVGAYWYSYAADESDALQEAKCFLEAVKGKSFEYPLCLDIEDSSQLKLSNAEVGRIINRFCSYLESKGYYACLYSYTDFLKRKVPLQCRTKYDVWAANFGSAKPDYTSPYGMWQYSDSGSVKGIIGRTDLDYAYKDYPAIMKEKGLNGYGKPQKVLDSDGFKKGDRSDGVLALKQLLILAKGRKIITQTVDNNGVFGAGTQKAVNELLGKWNCPQNGTAGANFIKKLRESISAV